MENLENTYQQSEQPVNIPEADAFNPQIAEAAQVAEQLKEFGKYGEAVSGAAEKALEKGVSQDEILAQTGHEYGNDDGHN